MFSDFQSDFRDFVLFVSNGNPFSLLFYYIFMLFYIDRIHMLTLLIIRKLILEFWRIGTLSGQASVQVDLAPF